MTLRGLTARRAGRVQGTIEFHVQWKKTETDAEMAAAAAREAAKRKETEKGVVVVLIKSGSGLKPKEAHGMFGSHKRDPFVMLTLQKNGVAVADNKPQQTRVLSGIDVSAVDPVWNERFDFAGTVPTAREPNPPTTA